MRLKTLGCVALIALSTAAIAQTTGTTTTTTNNTSTSSAGNTTDDISTPNGTDAPNASATPR